MKKSDQDLFYEAIGRQLTRSREQKKLSISQLATKASEQFNTVKAIEDGKPFMAHQLSWMKNILGINLNILIADALIENGIKEESNGEETIQNETSYDDFI